MPGARYPLGNGFWTDSKCLHEYPDDSCTCMLCGRVEHGDIDECQCLVCGADLTEEMAARAEWVAELRDDR